MSPSRRRGDAAEGICAQAIFGLSVTDAAEGCVTTAAMGLLPKRAPAGDRGARIVPLALETLLGEY